MAPLKPPALAVGRLMAWSCFLKKSKAESSDCVSMFPGYYAADLRTLCDHAYFKEAPESTRRRFLDFAIEVVKMDLVCPVDPAICRLKAERAYELIPISSAVPRHQVGRPYAEEQIIRLQGKTVLRLPVRVSKSSRKIPNYNCGMYLPEVELVILQHDPHRPDAPAVSDGYAAGVDVFRLVDAYDRLSLTKNLKFWLVDGEPVAEVKDPRIAFLYELARERHALQAGAAAEEDVLEAQKTAEAEASQEAEAAETAATAGTGEASRAAE